MHLFVGSWKLFKIAIQVARTGCHRRQNTSCYEPMHVHLKAHIGVRSDRSEQDVVSSKQYQRGVYILAGVMLMSHS